MAGVERVLVIGLSNIGDAILMSEAVAALHQRYPGAHLALVVGGRATALFVEDPCVQTLVDADEFGSPLGRLKLTAALWRFRPQIVVDLRSTIYPFFLKPLSAWRYLRRPPKAIRHMRDRHRWRLQAQVPGLGLAPGSPVWRSPKDAAHVDGLWRRWNLDGQRRLVLICPGARSQIKRWTVEGFARVADRLIGECAAQVIFSGEPAEEAWVEAILELMTHRAHSAVGVVTMRQLGMLMQRATLVITNDSGSLHLASAFDVPTVAIFGPTDPAKYGPTAARHRTVRRRLFCAPCERPLCRFNHECMRFLSADDVYEAACQLLRQETGDSRQGLEHSP